MATTTWIGPAEGLWSSPDNWSTGAVPVDGDVVHVADAIVTVDTEITGRVYTSGSLLEFTDSGLIGANAELIPSCQVTTLSAPSVRWSGRLSGDGHVRVDGSAVMDVLAGPFDGLLEIVGNLTVAETCVLGGQVEVGGGSTFNGSYAWRPGCTLQVKGKTVVSPGNPVIKFVFSDIDYEDIKWRTRQVIVACVGVTPTKGAAINGAAYGAWTTAIDGQLLVLIWCPTDKGAMVSLTRNSWLAGSVYKGRISLCSESDETKSLIGKWGAPSVGIGGNFEGDVDLGTGAVTVVIDAPSDVSGTQATVKAVCQEGRITSYVVTNPGSGYTTTPGAYLLHHYPQNPEERASSLVVTVNGSGGVDGVTSTTGEGYTPWETHVAFTRPDRYFLFPDQLPFVFSQATDYTEEGAEFAAASTKLWLDTVTQRIHTALSSLRSKNAPLQGNDITFVP